MQELFFNSFSEGSYELLALYINGTKRCGILVPDILSVTEIFNK
jgi:hypothetical protein